MKKKKKKYAKCPSCLVERHSTEVKICMAILEKIERKLYKHYHELGINTYEAFMDANFQWACDSCLKDRKAILANPVLQVYAFSPNLTYHDKDKTCQTCGSDFKFTKQEQQLWYEKLKFWMDSEPVNCVSCRRKIRLLRVENKTLSNILIKQEQEITIDELKNVADIYRKWDKLDKAKFYDALVEKRNRVKKNADHK